MEKIYSNYQERTEFKEVGAKTINFLLSFSKSFHNIKLKDLEFESFLN